MQSAFAAYVMATAVVIVWGTTFVSTKVLLHDLSPAAIMFYRYLLAYLALLIVYPRFHRPFGFRRELLFAGAGFFGGTLYFLAENYALQFSLASNVGLLLSASPMITALTARLLTREPLTRNLGVGFVVAFAGTFCIIFNGHFVLKLNPLGDMLAIAASVAWALYSILIKKIDPSINSLYCTRKIFFYSILTMLPVLQLTDFRWDWSTISRPAVAANLIYLGVLSSSVCFLIWTKVIWKLGPVRANNFIYLIPLVTLITSVLVLHEPLTLFALLGGGLIVSGVYVASVPRLTLPVSKRAD